MENNIDGPQTYYKDTKFVENEKILLLEHIQTKTSFLLTSKLTSNLFQLYCLQPDSLNKTQSQSFNTIKQKILNF